MWDVVRTDRALTATGHGRRGSGEGSAAGARQGVLAEVEDLLHAIRRTAARVEDLCRDSGGPSALPDPSRRAYQWLRLLSDPAMLEVHLDALRAAAGVARRRADAGGPVVRVDFYNISGLWNCRERRNGVVITAHEAFIIAPDDVLEALVGAAVAGVERSRGASGGPDGNRTEAVCRRRVQDHAAGDDFHDLALALELEAAPPAEAGRGRHHDLEEVFERVNEEYFGGRLERPILTWSRAITRRKLGHYQPSRDTVMISSTLDDPAIPPYVLDFVMYHELLHKKLGAKVARGRRHVHTPEFRRAERGFRHYREAEDYLKNLGRHLAK
jgi:hypothetical protein